MSYIRSETVEEEVTQFTSLIIHSTNTNEASNADICTADVDNREHKKLETVSERAHDFPDGLDTDISPVAGAIDESNVANKEHEKTETVSGRGPELPSPSMSVEAGAIDELNVMDSANASNKDKSINDAVPENVSPLDVAISTVTSAIEELNIADPAIITKTTLDSKTTDENTIVSGDSKASLSLSFSQKKQSPINKNANPQKSKSKVKQGETKTTIQGIATHPEATVINPNSPGISQSISDTKNPIQLQSQESVPDIDGETRHGNDIENRNTYLDGIQVFIDQGLVDESLSLSEIQTKLSSEAQHYSHRQIHAQPTSDHRFSDSTGQSPTHEERVEGAGASIDDNQTRSDIPSEAGDGKKDFVILRADDDERGAMELRDHFLRDFPHIQPPLTVDVFNCIDAGKSEFISLESLPGRYRFILLYATKSFRGDREVQFLSEIVILYGLRSGNEQFIPVWSEKIIDIHMYIKAIKGLQYWRFESDLRQIYIEQVNNLISGR